MEKKKSVVLPPVPWLDDQVAREKTTLQERQAAVRRIPEKVELRFGKSKRTTEATAWRAVD